MTFNEQKDMWVNGVAYENYVGRWSRLVARQFLKSLEIPSDSKWLDVGCGTGILSQTILDIASPQSVVGIDKSQEYIEYASKQIHDRRIAFHVGDVQSLPVEPSVYDVALSGLVLNFVPQPSLALTAMIRAVRLGGTVAAYVWDYAGQMQFIRYFWDAAVALDRTIFFLDEGRRFPLCHQEALSQMFRNAPLEKVKVWSIDVDTTFSDFDDYWSPFLGGQGPAPAYTMSLSEENRDALRECIRKKLPIDRDGSIHLIARAWAVLGVRKQ
jgi:SAM-dependent methyltransferase